MTVRSLTAAPATPVATGAGPVLGSLCTGYGGLDLGVLAALGGRRIAWVADPDPHIAQILTARMPGVPNLGDLRRIDWTRVEPVDVLVAGFPCQDISAAGRRAGIEKGVRSGLWADIVAGVRVLRPALVVVENVAALRWAGGGLHRVLGDLAEAGYDALWRSVRAADIGAAHRRDRVFLLAWHREPRTDRRDGRSGDATDAHRARRLLQRHQRNQQTGRPVTARPTPAATHPDGLGREERHPPHPHRRPIPTRRSTIPGRTRHVPADPPRDGRHEGLPGATRLQGRPDAALGGDPTAPTISTRQRQSGGRHLVAVPDHDADPVSASPGEPVPVNWGVYDAAIRRWEAVLRRPAPHPTQPGSHGRPVLAPAFVEHLMGLAAGWVTALPIPRTAQLRALGNGVVPQQAAHALGLLLDDLAELLHFSTDTAPAPASQEAAA